MTIKLDLEALNSDDFRSIAAFGRGATWQQMRDWLFQVAFQQEGNREEVARLRASVR